MLRVLPVTKDVIPAFRDNKKIFVGLFWHTEGLYGESIPTPRIVNRQANKANPLAISLLQFCRRSVFLPCIDTVLEQLSKRFCFDLADCIKLKFMITSVCLKHLLRLHQKCFELLSSFSRWQHWRYGGWICVMACVLAAPQRWFFTVHCFRHVAVSERKENVFISGSSLNIDNSSGCYSNTWAFV